MVHLWLIGAESRTCQLRKQYWRQCVHKLWIVTLVFRKTIVVGAKERNVFREVHPDQIQARVHHGLLIFARTSPNARTRLAMPA